MKGDFFINKKIIIIILLFMGLFYYEIAFIFSFEKVYPEKAQLELIAKIISIKEEKEYYDKYIIKVIENSKIKKSKNTKLIIYVDKSLNFIPGDIVYINGNFKKAEKSRNFGGFDYNNYLKQKKIYGILYCEKIEKIKSSSIFNLEKIRLYICMKTDELYNKEYSSFLKGILIGNTNDISENIKENFRNSSISHILAISGMHISYIIIVLDFSLKKMIKSKKLKNNVLIFFLILFTALTGFSASCIRACIMNIMILISSNLYRKNNFYISFLISLIIIFLINPFNIFNVGMWLSYAGTLGIVLFYNFFIKVAEKKLCKNNFKRLKIKFLKLFFISFSAQILIFPIVIYIFNTFSLNFFISNILISFLIGPILVIGYLSLLLSIFIFPLGRFCSQIEKKLIFIIFEISELCSNLPFSKIYVITPNIIIIFLYYFIIFYCVYIKKIYIIKLIISFKFLKNEIKKNICKYNKKIIIFLSLLILIFNFNKIDTNLKINFIDVGQGDSSLIITPNNKKILIDGGEGNSDKYDYGEKVLLPYLLDKKIKRIDFLIISHCDSDHIGGLFAILENLKVENVLLGVQPENSKQLQDLEKIIKNKKINFTILEDGNNLKLDKNIYLKVLWPNKENIVSDNALNNNSLVFKIIYKDFSVLFTGDIEKIAENEILQIHKNDLKSNIIKVAHHGSKTSTSEEFIKNVSPQIALIGVGENNKFGHPNEIVIKRLLSLRTRIFRTDEFGEIDIKVNKKGEIKNILTKLK